MKATKLASVASALIALLVVGFVPTAAADPQSCVENYIVSDQFVDEQEPSGGGQIVDETAAINPGGAATTAVMFATGGVLECLP